MMPLTARAKADVHLDRASPEFVALAPGQSGVMILAITNSGSDTAPSVPIGGSPDFHFLDSDYPAQMQPAVGCGALQPGGGGPFPIHFTYHFYAGPVAAGQTLYCAIHVTRTAGAVSSTRYGWHIYDFPDNPDSDEHAVDFGLGTLANIGLNVETIRFSLDNGIAHATLRIHAANTGHADVAPFTIGACTDNVQLAFSLDGQIANGCGPSIGHLCFDYGFGFQFPKLRASQSVSCDIALTGIAPYVGPEFFPLPVAISQPLVDANTGGVLIDTQPGDDSIYLALAAPVAGVPENTWLTRLVIGLGMILLGACTLLRIRGK